MRLKIFRSRPFWPVGQELFELGWGGGRVDVGRRFSRGVLKRHGQGLRPAAVFLRWRERALGTENRKSAGHLFMSINRLQATRILKHVSLLYYMSTTIYQRLLKVKSLKLSMRMRTSRTCLRSTFNTELSSQVSGLSLRSQEFIRH